MASYEYFYPGTPYSLEPTSIYGSSTAYTPIGELGLTTDPRTAAKLQDVSSKLNTGIKTMEVSTVSPEIFESIPEQHLKEINRLAKLTGSDITLHGPLIEASGYTREGWSEVNRQGAERQAKMVIERAHKLDPGGNIPVTFHSTAVGLPEGLELVKEKVEGKWKEVPKSMLIVDSRVGSVKQLKETDRYFPGEAKKFDPETELKRINEDSWTENVNQINFYALRGEELIDRVAEKVAFEAYERIVKHPEEFEKLPEPEKKLMQEGVKIVDHASLFLRDAYRGMRELYNAAYGAATRSDDKEAIEKLEDYKKKIEKAVTEGKGIEKEPAKMQEFAEIIRQGVKTLGSITPQIYKPLNEFLIEKSSQTFANAAFHGYKKFGEKAPIVSIENPPAGSALSRAADIKELIETARKNFVGQAKKEGVSESEAKAASEKLIGATWDVGHINQLRKYGYGREEMIKQAEKIAPFVKHVHLSDNFGYENVELPMGMGNVPLKEIMKTLEKEGFSGKKIIEAAAWWQHMKTPPLAATLEALGSPIYPMLAQPTWTQASAAYGHYFAFPSAYLPEQHFAMYGGGFSALPQELGGQIPGKQSRMTGTPMD